MTTSHARRHPWERREKESDPAWEAFAIYRDLGVKRSLAKVAAKVGKSEALVQRWSRTHAWVIRANAWDVEEDRQHVRWMRQQRRKSEARDLKLARKMIDVATSGIENMLTTPSLLEPKDVARLAEVATKMQALAYGRATEIVSIQGGGSSSDRPSTDHVKHLGDEDRHMRMLQLQREVGERLKESGELA